VTLQNAEHSTLADRSPVFLPVAVENKPLDIASTRRGSSWNSLIGELTPDGGLSVGGDDDDEQLKRRSLEYCNSRRSAWPETSEEGLYTMLYSAVFVRLVCYVIAVSKGFLMSYSSGILHGGNTVEHNATVQCVAKFHYSTCGRIFDLYLMTNDWIMLKTLHIEPKTAESST